MRKIKALVVDDSALMRTMLTEILSNTDDIQVVGTASDPYIARDKIKQLEPDVLTLDVEMPRMDGLSFLRNLMRLHPLPVVMLSSLTAQGADVTMQALAYGAVDFVQKPDSDLAQNLPAYADEIVAKVRNAARCRVKPLRAGNTEKSAGPVQGGPALPREKLVALGASTGGTEAIKDFVRGLPADFPPIVISQHLPLAFSASFAKHVDQATAMTAKLATDGERILHGHIYIAPGERHLKVARRGNVYQINLSDEPPVNRHRPSVDVMFQSVAESAGREGFAIMLTGMGADGAQGMKQMRDSGARTVAQDEASSVVWGMPGEAYRLGAVEELVPLDKMASRVMELLR